MIKYNINMIQIEALLIVLIRQLANLCNIYIGTKIGHIKSLVKKYVHMQFQLLET